MDALWPDFPHYPLPAPIKAYYLLQFTSWVTQMVILHVEARRKDHYQMLTHHIITLVLVAMTYFCGLTRVGCVTLVLMDFSDIMLPVSIFHPRNELL